MLFYFYLTPISEFRKLFRKNARISWKLFFNFCFSDFLISGHQSKSFQEISIHLNFMGTNKIMIEVGKLVQDSLEIENVAKIGFIFNHLYLILSTWESQGKIFLLEVMNTKSMSHTVWLKVFGIFFGNPRDQNHAPEVW